MVLHCWVRRREKKQAEVEAGAVLVQVLPSLSAEAQKKSEISRCAFRTEKVHMTEAGTSKHARATWEPRLLAAPMWVFPWLLSFESGTHGHGVFSPYIVYSIWEFSSIEILEDLTLVPRRSRCSREKCSAPAFLWALVAAFV